MAVMHPEVAVPGEVRPSRRLRRAVASIAALVLLAGLAAGAAAATWFGYEHLNEGRVLPGVSAGGVPLAGLTRPEAEAALRTALAGHFDGRLTLVIDGRIVRRSYAELGRATDVAATIDAAMTVGRQGDLETRLRERLAVTGAGIAVAPVLAFDPAPVHAWIGSLGAQTDRAAVPASVTLVAGGARVLPDELGRRFDRTAAAAQIMTLLGDPAASPTTLVKGRVDPTVAAYTDLDAARVVTGLRRVARPFELAVGPKTWKVTATQVRSWVRLVPSRAGPVLRLDAAAIARGIPKAAVTAARRKPIETSYLVTRGGNRIGFVAGTPGRRLNRGATANRIVGLLRARAAGAPIAPGPVEAATTRLPIELTPEEAAKRVPEMVRIGSWTTTYQVSERNGFGANITIPARAIDRTVLRPGQVFDFWGAVGPVSYARGYRDGAIIVGGRSQPTGAIAGGICSTSTTLFNAAARAGLQILERDNHYYYISRYPLGLDATVSKKGGRVVQNMRFRNDTDYSIFIRGEAGPGWVRFTLYSLPNGRTVTFSKPKVWGIVPARDSVVYTSTLPTGQKKRVEYPVDGMNVLVTRTVREGGRVIHREDYYTRYGRVDGVLEIGI